jgi:hypothetical protein
MSFDWSDYSADSDTEEVSLLLSTRSQSLILAAMETLDSRFNWVDVDDSTWDDIHAAVGEAYEEIMESVVMPQGTIGGIRMFSSINVNVGSPVSTWNSVEFNETNYDTDDFNHSSAITNYFEVPAGMDGVYLIGAHVLWASNAATSQRQSRIIKNFTELLSFVQTGTASQNIAQVHTTTAVLAEGDIIQLDCFTAVSNLNVINHGNYSPSLWMERVR